MPDHDVLARSRNSTVWRAPGYPVQSPCLWELHGRLTRAGLVFRLRVSTAIVVGQLLKAR